jgi:hypothetical protein
MKPSFFIVLLFSAIGWSQSHNLTGVIKDANTMEPIPYVTISFENSVSHNYTGGISNENGEFSITDSGGKVIFNHVNYEPLSLELKYAHTEVLLQLKNYLLEEVVISKISPRDYLSDIIKNANSKVDKNTLLKSYCREIVKVNNDISKFSDGMVDYYVKKGNGKSEVIVSQHRAYKSNAIDDADDKSVEAINTIFDVKEHVQKAYSFNALEKVVVNGDYDFVRKIKKDTNGAEYEYIEIIPNEKSKHLLNKGYVIVDIETKNILEYKIYTSESHVKNARFYNFLFAKAKIHHTLKWSKFKIINDQYLLIYNKKELGVFLSSGKTLNHDFDFTSDLFVYEFDKDVPLPATGYTKKSLFQAGTSYTNEYWKNHNVFPLSTAEEHFIHAIQIK